MTTQKLNHKNIVLPQLPDHSESRKFQNIAMSACLGLALLTSLSLIVVML
ncbi:hypothetical protein [Marinicellulosiphila megalodicopiae]